MKDVCLHDISLSLDLAQNMKDVTIFRLTKRCSIVIMSKKSCILVLSSENRLTNGSIFDSK